MSSKPYIAFFEVGKDANQIVEVNFACSNAGPPIKRSF